MIQNNTMLVTMTVGQLTQIIQDVVEAEICKLGRSAANDEREDNQLMTREEVGKLLKVSTTTLYHWNKSKILVATKIGRRVYYSRTDVMSRLIK